MIRTINEYLLELDKAMLEFDPATRQDALADAEDHLQSAMLEARQAAPDKTEEELLQAIIGEYGSPQETSEAYHELDTRFQPMMKTSTVKKNGSPFVHFFSVYSDPRTWGALFYCLISLVTGSIYFGWAATGVSTSISLLILIIGIPVAMLFFFSFLGLSFLEGRLVEAFLGERMPRRQRFLSANMTWKEKMKRLLLSKDIWLSVLYFILLYPVKVFAFSLTITLIATGLALIVAPILQGIFSVPFIQLGSQMYLLPTWSLPLISIGGVLFLTLSMHIIRGLGTLQGKIAKAMLVTK